MNFIIECQIDTTGKSNGLNIPTGFRMGITSVNKNIKDDGTVDVIFEVATYKNDTYSKRIDNDDVPWRNPYNMSKADAFTTTDQTLFNNHLKVDVIAAYGAGNIQVL
jgi:hypothetical protein